MRLLRTLQLAVNLCPADKPPLPSLLLALLEPEPLRRAPVRRQRVRPARFPID